jgi:type IV pilus assembly protein PilV
MNYKMMNKQAFTMIEALMSVAIMAIGFSGVYGLVSASNQVLNDSIDREKLNFQSREIIESLQADQTNILAYHNKDLSNCGALTTSKGKEDQLIRLKQWCNKLEGDIGSKRSMDKRRIQVEKKQVGTGASKKFVYVVSINLAGKKGDKTTFIKKVFDAD